MAKTPDHGPKPVSLHVLLDSHCGDVQAAQTDYTQRIVGNYLGAVQKQGLLSEFDGSLDSLIAKKRWEAFGSEIFDLKSDTDSSATRLTSQDVTDGKSAYKYVVDQMVGMNYDTFLVLCPENTHPYEEDGYSVSMGPNLAFIESESGIRLNHYTPPVQFRGVEGNLVTIQGRWSTDESIPEPLIPDALAFVDGLKARAEENSDQIARSKAARKAELDKQWVTWRANADQALEDIKLGTINSPWIQRLARLSYINRHLTTKAQEKERSDIIMTMYQELGGYSDRVFAAWGALLKPEQHPQSTTSQATE